MADRWKLIAVAVAITLAAVVVVFICPSADLPLALLRSGTSAQDIQGSSVALSHIVGLDLPVLPGVQSEIATVEPLHAVSSRTATARTILTLDHLWRC